MSGLKGIVTPNTRLSISKDEVFYSVTYAESTIGNLLHDLSKAFESDKYICENYDEHPSFFYVNIPGTDTENGYPVLVASGSEFFVKIYDIDCKTADGRSITDLMLENGEFDLHITKK